MDPLMDQQGLNNYYNNMMGTYSYQNMAPMDIVSQIQQSRMLSPEQLIDKQGGARAPQSSFFSKDWWSDPHNINTFSTWLGGMGAAMGPQGGFGSNLGKFAMELAGADEKRRYLADRDAAMQALGDQFIQALVPPPTFAQGEAAPSAKGGTATPSAKGSGKSAPKNSPVADATFVRDTVGGTPPPYIPLEMLGGVEGSRYPYMSYTPIMSDILSRGGSRFGYERETPMWPWLDNSILNTGRALRNIQFNAGPRTPAATY